MACYLSLLHKMLYDKPSYWSQVNTPFRIIYWVLFLALLSAIEAMNLYAQGSFLEPKKLAVLAEQGGHITSAALPYYSIYGSKGDSEILGEGDIVFLDSGSGQGIKPGDQLRVFRVVKLIIHPVTKEKLGNLIKVIGKLRITEASDKTSTAIITDMYDNPIFKGDRVIPLTHGGAGQGEATSGRKEGEGVTGYIVAIKDEKRFATQGDIVYIDQGKANAIAVGDTFNIQHPDRLNSATESQIGMLRIIAVQEKTSTAVISHSSTEIAVGDIIVE